ncbi:hypothetical protein L3i20_v223300 [Paenibacillus sp. L3-i20]|nr:hypothetical protein L3i20_v223300 [Paenibacillus sp. L3-i20]
MVFSVLPKFDNAEYSHHERYDGRGYPDELARTDIPLLGRVIAIADAYDAMTSNHPYRKGMPPERALAILEDGKGTQWDPELTEIFLGFGRNLLIGNNNDLT